MLVDLLVIAVLGTIASRLLGLRLSWPRRLLAAFLGMSGGTVVAFFLAGWRPPQNPRSVDIPEPAIWAWSLLGTLAAVGLFELAGRPGGSVGLLTRTMRLPHVVRELQRRIHRTFRYFEVIRIAARHGLGGGLLARNPDDPDGPVDLSSARVGKVGRALRSTLEEAGGAFVKFGQFLSTRPDLVPAEITAELAGLQDDVAKESPAHIDALLEAELGGIRKGVFAEFDPEPVAAASIAQVHRARLATGELVAVKVQRPGVRRIVERDLDITRRLAHSAEARVEWAGDLGAVDLAEGFAAALREELDFRIEARNIKSVTRTLQSTSSVRVPAVHESLSTSRVLVLEWMEGVPLQSATTFIDDHGLERTALARGLLRVVLRQMMVHGVFHADPHPGNVLVRADGTLALIDFGSVGRLDSLQQSALTRIMLAIGNNDPRQLRDALLEVASVPTSTDEDLLERALGQFQVRRLGDEAVPDAGLFRDLFNLLLEFKLSFPPALGGVFRALTTLDGTLNQLHPGFNMIAEARADAKRWVSDLVAPQSLDDVVAAEALSLVPVLRRLPRRVDRIAGSAERGELSVNVRLLADRRDVRMVNRLVNRGLLTVIAAALGFISTQLLDTTAGPELTPSLRLMEAIGYLGLAISAVLFLRAFVAVMTTDR